MNKITNEFVQKPNKASFLVRKFDKQAFDAPYHAHKEYELTLITGGSGKRYVGSHIADFTTGDLVLLGPHLPHCWKLEEKLKGRKLPGAIVVHFDYDFMGSDFLERPETRDIRELLGRAGGGIKFHPENKLRKRIEQLDTKYKGLKRLTAFLELLNDLAGIKSMILDQNDTLLQFAKDRDERVKRIFTYIVENFHERLSLKVAADLIHMTPQSFCKYFKTATRKTFTDVVIDYRIDYASSQLTKTEKTISTIGYESGFGDRSYFSKKFKEKTGFSPSSYRRAYKKL